MHPESASPDASVVRALLLTDLVDSTRLIERLGDRRAARVLAEEEEAARRLAQRFAGQEIDRSDGFLFIFTHAWQAVGFALEYHRALDQLSAGLPLRLCGRVGIHVGETYLVPNSAENVARGAKQMEVSGLAKPIAARLMSAANPGQTLLSGTAHDLARRPCAEMLPPQPAQHWFAHGAYVLKGVEQPVQVFAVGDDDKVVAREPRENDKVRSLRRRRRRRFLLAATGATAVAALPAGYWLWRRQVLQRWESQWLVIADWTLESGEASLAHVLATAFRIALQQSRFAFVMDAGAVQATLQRMRGEPPVDRDKAVEIARRESAAAAIVPSFASFGGGVLLSAEVVEAAGGRTVAAAQEQIAGLAQLTEALDRLAAKIRRSVGEPDVDIQRDALPLAKVTTADLEALRLYSESDVLLRQRQDDEAIGLLERAIVLDPEFASAHAKLGTLHLIKRSDPATSERHWRRAAALDTRLTRRERMYVDGCLSWTEDPVAMRARWSTMAAAFPEDAAAVNNAAYVEWTQFGDLAAAERGFRQGLEIKHPWNYALWHHLGYTQMGQGRLDESLATFEESLARADHPTHFGMLRALLLKDDVAAAQALLERFRGSGAASWQLDHAEAEVLLLAYGRQFEAAVASVERLRDQALTQRFRSAERVGLRCRLLLCDALGDTDGARAAAAALRQVLGPELETFSGNLFVLPPFELLELAAHAARRGWDGFEVRPEQLLVGRWAEFPVLQAQADLLRGWLAVRAGRPEEALRHAMQGRDRAPLFAFLELEIAAYDALGQAQSRAERERQAQSRLAQGLAENYNHFSTHLANLLAWQRLRDAAAARAQPASRT
jgi:putative peptide modification system cyclase